MKTEPQRWKLAKNDETMGMFQAAPVNLIEELCKLAFSFSKQAEAEIKRMTQPNNVLQRSEKGGE